MILSDLDYIEDNEGNFWIVHGGDRTFYCNKVFSLDPFGERVRLKDGKRYTKVILDNMDFVPLIKINVVGVFKPREFFREYYSKIPREWKKIPKAFIQLGIKKEDIGIFGSFLLGFELVKDIDFVVYGKENCKLIISNIEKLKELVGCKSISKEHIDYQCKKYGTIYSTENDFSEIISRNIAGLQFSKGVLSTIRFVYYPNEEPRDLEVLEGEDIVLVATVLESFGFHFVPRIAYLDSSKGRIRLLTYNWMFKGCLNEGEKILLRGEYVEKNKTIYLSKRNHWLKYVL